MKTIAKIFVLALILSSCTTREGKENLYTPWYQYSLLVADSTDKVDTVYMDGVTAGHIAEFPISVDKTIEVQKTSIGYVYSTHEYVTRDVIKSYFWGLWEEVNQDPQILPIEKMRFKKILQGAEPRDPYMRMFEEEMKQHGPR